MTRSTPANTLIGLYMQSWQSLAILAAANLGIADELDGTPRRVEDLARALGVHPRSLCRLLRALCSRGIFRQTGTCEFTHSVLSEALRAGAPGGAREVIRLLGLRSTRAACVAYEHAIATGESALELFQAGVGPYERLSSDSAEAEIYDMGMTAAALTQTEAILRAFDFARFETLVDVGGGRGALLASILARNPAQRGILFDFPHVIEQCGELLSQYGVRDRCELRAGDFRSGIPGEGDGYILKNVLHGYRDADCLDVLLRIRESARPGAHVLVIEMVMPVDQPSVAHTMFDLFLLLGGAESRVRAEPEFRELLREADFGSIHFIRTDGPACIIDAQAAG